jgi:membrane associated rhomboid family serine protease/Flp pilus assembly protein TadD
MAKCIRCGRQLQGFSLKKICPWCVQHEAAQRGEDGDEPKQRVMPAPWLRQHEGTISLTQILFGANIAVFLAMALASGTITSDFPGSIAVRFGANYGPYTLAGQWWRLFTYMFLHGGIWHIVFNLWCLWDLGALCESLYGRSTYLCIYLITGIAAGLTSVAWNPGVLSVGASGAIFGLAGALAASFYLGEFSIPRFAIQGTLRSLAFFIGFNVLFGVGYNFILGGSAGYVDNACHVGGLVSGAILGALIAKFAADRDRAAPRIAVLLLITVALAGAVFGVARWRGPSMRFGRTIFDVQQNANRKIADFRKRVQQNPRDAAAHYALAHEYFITGQESEGVSELKRVLELDPKNESARTDLGAVYLDQGNAKESQEQFAALLAQDANSVNGHVGLGMALADQQNHAAAIHEFQEAARLSPQTPGLYYRMGASQFQLKHYDDAIGSYMKERELNGDDPKLETALAEAYEAKGMTREAQEARSRAAQMNGGRPEQ